MTREEIEQTVTRLLATGFVEKAELRRQIALTLPASPVAAP